MYGREVTNILVEQFQTLKPTCFEEWSAQVFYSKFGMVLDLTKNPIWQGYVYICYMESSDTYCFEYFRIDDGKKVIDWFSARVLAYSLVDEIENFLNRVLVLGEKKQQKAS